jgi:hypothetical protein
MAIDYQRLDSKLGELYSQMMPAYTSESAYAHFRAKVDAYRETRHERYEAARRASTIEAIAGGLGATVGMWGIGAAATGLVAVSIAPVVGAAGAAIAFAVPTATIASMLVRKLAGAREEAEINRARSLLHRSADVVMRAWNKEVEGGFLGRLYGTVMDRMHGYESRVEKISQQIDRLNVRDFERSEAITRIVRAQMAPDPGLLDYVKRAALDPYSGAAGMLRRVRDQVDLDAVAEQVAPASRPAFSVLTQVGVTTGMAATFAAQKIASAVRDVLPQHAAAAAAAPQSTQPALAYGWISAQADDREFLRSIGIEVGAYNEGTSQFMAKMSAQVRGEFTTLYGDSFPAALHELPAGVTDATTHVATVPFDSMTRETLNAYRMSLQFEAAQAGGDAVKVIEVALGRANEEHRSRVNEARRAMTVAASTSPSLDM